MIPHPDDDQLLDQNLRETFSDFSLQPSRQVWAGIEGRIGALPGGQPATARRLPLKFLLPAVVLVSVSVGWLLPRPSGVRTAAQAPAAELPRLPASAEALAATPASAPVAATPPIELATLQPAPAAVYRRAASSLRPAPAPSAVPAQPAPVALLSPEPAELQAVALPALELRLSSSAGSSADFPRAQEPGLPATDATLPANAETKPGPQHESRTEFRQPTHRMAERGRGARRRMTSVALWVRQLINPRRARTTGQPNF